jgi:hypothetical protein
MADDRRSESQGRLGAEGLHAGASGEASGLIASAANGNGRLLAGFDCRAGVLAARRMARRA